MSLLKQVNDLGPWYHTISLTDGVETPGLGDNISEKFETLSPYLRDDLSDLKVLDVGCNAGGLALEFARRGASCKGIEFSVRYHAQAEFCADTLGLTERCTFERGDIYSLINDSQEYDVVLFMGLIYHLRYPQLAIDLLSERCRGRMFVNSPTVMPADKPIAEFRAPEDVRPHRLSEYPKFNLWFPSVETMVRMMRLAGFTSVEVAWHKENSFVSSSGLDDNSTHLPTGQGMVTGVRDSAFTPVAASELWAYRP